MADRISIRDLAQIAGVSRTTVSLALRGSHEVAPATRERILQLARQHDYRSHPAINALMAQVGKRRRIDDEETIAFVHSSPSADNISASTLEILAAARREAYRLGYRIEVFWAGFCGQQSEHLARVLYHRGIRGVIWAAMPYPHPPLQFPWEKFTSIACTPSTQVPNLPYVSIHHAKGMALLIEELQQRGAERIGFIRRVVDDSRQHYGWHMGVELYHKRGGKAKVLSLPLREDLDHAELDANDRTRLGSWIKRNRIDTLIMPDYVYDRTDYLAGKMPRASLGVRREGLGQEGGLFQDAHLIGQHVVQQLSMGMATGALGLPSHSYSIVIEVEFKWGKSLLPLKRGADST